MIQIADTRFQPQLLAQAKKAGKIEAGYEIPEAFRSNTPAALEQRLALHRGQGRFGAFPLGSDFTSEELLLAAALKQVKARAATTPKWKLLLAALTAGSPPAAARPFLERLQLTRAEGLQDRVARALLIEELRSAGAF